MLKSIAALAKQYTRKGTTQATPPPMPGQSLWQYSSRSQNSHTCHASKSGDFVNAWCGPVIMTWIIYVAYNGQLAEGFIVQAKYRLSCFDSGDHTTRYYRNKDGETREVYENCEKDPPRKEWEGYVVDETSWLEGIERKRSLRMMQTPFQAGPATCCTS